MKAEEKKTLESIVESPTMVNIEIPSIVPKWMFWKKRVAERITLDIKPYTLGRMIDIALTLDSIDVEEVKTIGDVKFIAKNGQKVLEVLSLALFGDKKHISVLEANITPHQMVSIFTALLAKMDVMSFTNSIVFALAMGVQTSQLTEEIIASGESSAE